MNYKITMKFTTTIIYLFLMTYLTHIHYQIHAYLSHIFSLYLLNSLIFLVLVFMILEKESH